MRTFARWSVAVLLVLHGLIHVMGAAKGVGWADVPDLREPVGPVAGWLWLAAGAVTVTAGVLLAARVRRWWLVGAAALVLSQAMVLTAWSDAWRGTLANAVLLLAVVHGAVREGPWSLPTEYQRRSRSALSHARHREPVVTEADLAGLPAAVASYVRASGAVGKPRVRVFRARISGRIRAGIDKPWMEFAGEQVNTYEPSGEMCRLFLMDATMAGLPVDVLHVFADRHATMRVRAMSLVGLADAAGPELDQAETVTLFNDMCVMAPAVLPYADVTWEPLDEHSVRGTLHYAGHDAAAVLVFDDDHRLVDFISDDRLRAGSDGAMTRQRWSTPLWDYRDRGDGRWGARRGEARWHAPEGEFAYLDLRIESVDHDPA